MQEESLLCKKSVWVSEWPALVAVSVLSAKTASHVLQAFVPGQYDVDIELAGAGASTVFAIGIVLGLRYVNVFAVSYLALEFTLDFLRIASPFVGFSFLFKDLADVTDSSSLYLSLFFFLACCPIVLTKHGRKHFCHHSLERPRQLTGFLIVSAVSLLIACGIGVMALGHGSEPLVNDQGVARRDRAFCRMLEEGLANSVDLPALSNAYLHKCEVTAEEWSFVAQVKFVIPVGLQAEEAHSLLLLSTTACREYLERREFSPWSWSLEVLLHPSTQGLSEAPAVGRARFEKGWDEPEVMLRDDTEVALNGDLQVLSP